MITPPSWTIFQRRADSIIDNWLGERVELHPWTNEGFGSEGGPDPNRAVLAGPDIIGCYVTAGSGIVGELSTGAAGASTKLLELDVWLSIQSIIIGPLTNWKADDRVYFPDRDEWFLISYPGPSATFRPNIHLIRLNDNALKATVERSVKINRRFGRRLRG
jgi:hypothetical protein